METRPIIGMKACSGIALSSLREAFKHQGCPICRLVRKTEEKAITILFYEGLSDPETRRKLLESGGFCPYHSWMTVEYYWRRLDTIVEPLGLTILHLDLLEKEIEDLEQGKQRSSKGSSCLICRSALEAEESLVNALASCLDEDLLEEYRRGPSLLCRNHYSDVAAMLSKRDPGLLEELARVQRGKLEDLRGLARSFIDKADYRSREEPSSEEATAWYRILEYLKGYNTSPTICRR